MRRTAAAATAVLVLALAACESNAPTAALDPSAAAFAKPNTTTTNQMVPLENAIVTDPCTGEQVVFNGKGHVRTTTTDMGGGVLHVRTHINYAGLHGVGVTSGLKYQIVAAAKQEQTTTTEPYSYAYETKQQVGLISQGPSDNWKSHMTVASGYDGVDSYYLVLRDDTRCVG